MGATWRCHAYGSQPRQHLYFCAPSRQSNRKPALLLFIHGGYWQELTAKDSLFPALGCINEGHAFCAIDYSLAPQVRLEEIVFECRAAVNWLMGHADLLGFDAGRLVIAGSSAGAHLAAMAGISNALGGQLPLQGLVLVSGIYALEPLIGTSIDTALNLSEDEARKLSPSLQNLAGMAPSLVCWGEIETREFKRQSCDFSAQLRTAGASCHSFEIVSRNHFDVIFDLTDPDTELGQRTLAML